MKKTLYILFIFLLAIAVALPILWKKRASILSHFLSRRMHAPISMEEILFYKGGCKITDFHLSNIPPCKTANAFFAKTITFKATLSSLIQKRVEIEEIYLKDLVLGIEYLTASGDKNNWTVLLENPSDHRSSNRPYLVRAIIFDNIHVLITQLNGTTKKVVIDHLEFHDISDKSGFPIEKLEKAIFQSMMQTIFKQLGIQTILKMLQPTNIPRLFQFFPFGKNSPKSEQEDSPCSCSSSADKKEFSSGP
jgi:hypothetical protein